MFDFLYQADDYTLFFIINSFFLIISIAAVYLIKWYFPLHLRYQENAVIGCTSAFVVLIYGVIAGFATSHLINSNNIALDALQREANAIVDLYRDTRWLSDPARTNMQTIVKEYLNEVIEVEWPYMNEGLKLPHEGGMIIGRISSDLQNYKIQGPSDTIIVSDMVGTIKSLYDAREQRILASYATLNGTLWVVIVLGSILTLCISYLYGVNFRLHIFIVIASALMVSSIIFLLISLDKPFVGAYSIGPETYQALRVLIDTR